MSTPRDNGLDAVRGLAMWMIVVSHFALWFYPTAPDRYWLSLPCQMIALPLFFFMSARMQRRVMAWGKLGRRAVRFAVITVVGTVLLAFAMQLSVAEALEPEHLFFWFFIALIIFEAAGTALRHLTQRVSGEVYRLTITLILMVLIEAIFFTAYRQIPWLPIVPLYDLRNMWPCYALGLLCAMHPSVGRQLRGTKAFTVGLLCLATAFVLSSDTGDRLFLLGTVAATVVSCRVAEWMRRAALCAVVGRQALWVYIIHPFLLTLLYRVAAQWLVGLSTTPWAMYTICIAGGAVTAAVIGCAVEWIVTHCTTAH